MKKLIAPKIKSYENVESVLNSGFTIKLEKKKFLLESNCWQHFRMGLESY